MRDAALNRAASSAVTAATSRLPPPSWVIVLTRRFGRHNRTPAVVNSVVRKLGAGLNNLEAAGLAIHPALRGAWSKMYGWTSDESGIRHGSHPRGGRSGTRQIRASDLFGFRLILD